jgi:hypothetical protein
VDYASGGRRLVATGGPLAARAPEVPVGLPAGVGGAEETPVQWRPSAAEPLQTVLQTVQVGHPPSLPLISSPQLVTTSSPGASGAGAARGSGEGEGGGGTDPARASGGGPEGHCEHCRSPGAACYDELQVHDDGDDGVGSRRSSAQPRGPSILITKPMGAVLRARGPPAGGGYWAAAGAFGGGESFPTGRGKNSLILIFS